MGKMKKQAYVEWEKMEKEMHDFENDCSCIQY
jgi:hypothetical protein